MSLGRLGQFWIHQNHRVSLARQGPGGAGTNGASTDDRDGVAQGVVVS